MDAHCLVHTYPITIFHLPRARRTHPPQNMFPNPQRTRISYSAGWRIPPEVLIEILECLTYQQLLSRERNLKAGLTNCALVCRFWAKVIRDILFFQLNLRSHDELRELAAFNAVPDCLGYSIERCVRDLNITYDPPPVGIPWAHDIPSYGGFERHRNLFVKWIVQGKPGEKNVFARLRAGRPRSVPPSVMTVHSLVIRDLHDLRVRDLLQYARSLGVRHVELHDVRFVEGTDVKAIPRPFLTLREYFLMREYKVDCMRCVRGADELVFWVRLINAVAAGFRLPYVLAGSPTEARLLRQFRIALDLHQCHGSTMSLQLRDGRSSHPQLASAWAYDLSVPIGDTERTIVSVDVYFWLNVHPGVHQTWIHVPAIKSPSDMERFNTIIGSLPRFYAPGELEKPIYLNCWDEKDMRTIVCAILEDRILPHDSPDHVSFRYTTLFGCDPASRIRSVPTTVDLGDGTMVDLTTEQRRELLYCGPLGGRERFIKKLRREVHEQRMGVLQGGTGQV